MPGHSKTTKTKLILNSLRSVLLVGCESERQQEKESSGEGNDFYTCSSMSLCAVFIIQILINSAVSCYGLDTSLSPFTFKIAFAITLSVVA